MARNRDSHFTSDYLHVSHDIDRPNKLFAILISMNLKDETNPQPAYVTGPIQRDEMMLEIKKEMNDRMSRIGDDFTRGFEKISRLSNTVTIFGSARFKETHPSYVKARDVGTMLADQGYTVITGGGGGIMEAGNRGAFEAGGTSIGFNIILPQEQAVNPYVSDSIALRYFFSRKVLLAFSAQAYIFFPGGFGTLDEFFEIITLIQTEKIPAAPIILVGDEFWGALDSFVQHELLELNYTISPGDEKLYTITEDIQLIQQIVDDAKQKRITEILTDGS